MQKPQYLISEISVKIFSISDSTLIVPISNLSYYGISQCLKRRKLANAQNKNYDYSISLKTEFQI